MAKRKGLWANIHAKRKRGERPAKPGEKGYPKTLDIEGTIKEQYGVIDPRGNTYFWLAGEAVKDLQSAGEGPNEWPSDVAQIASSSPSLTPIQPDLFWRGKLDDLPKLNF